MGLSTITILGPLIVVEIVCRNNAVRQFIITSSFFILLVGTIIFAVATKYAVDSINSVRSERNDEDPVPPI